MKSPDNPVVRRVRRRFSAGAALLFSAGMIWTHAALARAVPIVDAATVIAAAPVTASRPGGTGTAPSAMTPAGIKAVRVAMDGALLRLVFELDATDAPVLTLLEYPPRVVIDFPGLSAADVPALPVDTGQRIRALRSAAMEPGPGVRIVLELTEAMTVAHRTVPAEGDFGFRLALDLRTTAAQDATVAGTQSQNPTPKTMAIPPAPASPRAPMAAGEVTVPKLTAPNLTAPRAMDARALLQVAAPSVNLRAAPRDDARITGTAARGLVLKVIERRGEWYRVATAPDQNQSAWVLDAPIAHGDTALISFTGNGAVRFAEADMGTAQAPSGDIGRWRPDNHGRKLVTLPPVAAHHVPPPAPNLPRESLPLPDRWRVMQALGFKFPWYDPYHQNVLKGDLPVPALGDDVFANVGVLLDGLGEFREVPLPVNPSVAFGPDSTDAFGDPTQNLQSGTLLLNLALTRGNTTYMPPEYELRFTPVFNYNRAEVREAGILRADPLDCRTEVTATDEGSGASDPTVVNPTLPVEDDGLDNLGAPDTVVPTVTALDTTAGAPPRITVLEADDHCVRHDHFVGIQEFFLDYHLRDVSDRYDFDSIRVGIQPFTNDFRGFLFQDLQFGVRIFGNRDNNQWQYNLAWFRRVEKDTNSGLNDISEALRDDDLYLANVYRQDFPMVGFTSELSVVHNRNHEDAQYADTNGFVVRPAIVGNASRRPASYQVTYLGYAGDGHLRSLWPEGRLNLTTATYAALGTQDFNAVAGSAQDVRAFFHASELSRDFSWSRLRASVLYASGDGDPLDHEATGFDAIFENPQFAGADTSYWVRQGIPLIGGGAVALSGRNGVLASLRSSKEQGQSNFVNPGLILVGVGADFDIAPELRLLANANHLWFEDTETLEYLRAQTLRDTEIGYDLSAGLQWRPLFNQNIVINASGAVLLAGRGLRDLYGGTRHSTLYSAFLNAVFAY